MPFKRVRAIYSVLFAVVPLLFSSCIATRHLPRGSKLLVKNEVVVRSSENLNKVKKTLEQNVTLESKMATLAKQQPNRKTLGIGKFNLWIYDKFYTTQDSGFKHYLITQMGEPYVLFDSTTMAASAQTMKGFLIGKGYLNAEVSYDYKFKHKRRAVQKKAIAIYNVNTGPLYTIDSVFFPPDTSVLNAIASGDRFQTLLKPGDAFDANVIEKEQQRIQRDFQNEGYFNFRRDYIFFLVDTQGLKHKVKLYVRVERDADTATEQMTYSIKDIYLFPDYDPEFEIKETDFDTTIIGGMHFLSKELFLKPDILSDAVFLKQGALYSRTNYDCTLKSISDLAVYKFANVRFEELPGRQLNSFIYLQPAKKFQVGTEILVGNIEDNFASGLKLSFQSKNLFKKANRLDVSATGGIQIPVFPKVVADSLFYNVLGRIEYTLPRFAFPFINPRISCYNNPETKISLLASYYQQTNYYTMTNYGAAYSMEWKEVDYPLKKIVAPILGINYVFPTTTPLFDERLEQDPYLAKSFEKQFIMSLGGAYIFSNQQVNKPINFTYYSINLETAGNMLWLFNKYVTNRTADESGSYSVFGVNFSNYVRSELDLRRYISLSSNRTMVFRFNPGIAVPYGNSQVIPYVKQFYVGGTNSMRAWRVRSLGPGSYMNPNDSIEYYSSAGDIKLEGNIEYRYNVFGMLKGAAFVDIGNIWTFHADTTSPGSVFYLDTFYKQFGIDVGLGLRLDFSYFIMRLDFATKVYDPSLLDSGQTPWVIKNFCIYCDSDGDGNSEFGKDIILQLAVGYPF